MRETAQLRLSARAEGRYGRDLAVVLLAAAAVIAVVAHGPSTTLSYAQLHHIGSVVSVAQGGDWLLPRCVTRGMFHKPPLAIWAGAAAVRATGLYNNFVFRLPTVLAFFAVAVMVYLLGRTWYGPRVGVLAACLWATAFHMSKVSYLALTDMLFTAWLTGSILCADRLLFHRQGVRRRWAWAIGLWATVILGAMTKGWGLVNAALLGGMLALAAVGSGFRAAPGVKGIGNKMLWAVRFVLGRWWKAARALYLPWGLIAALLVLGPLLAAMIVVGGEEFKAIAYKEVWQRLTGTGEAPPLGTSVPPVAQLLYYQFPVSVFAVGAVFLAKRRQWFSRRALLLPASWILAVVVPFSVSHGFRPDYLLPCYAAVALMGAWAVDRLAWSDLRTGLRSAVRHLFAAAPVIGGTALVLVPIAYGLSAHGGWPAPKLFRDPQTLDGPTRWLIVVTGVVGIIVVAASVHASLTWRIYRLGGLAALASLGLIFLYTHTLSEHARSLDGEKAALFTRAVRGTVDDGPVALCGAEQAGVHLYLGPTRWWLVAPSDLERKLGGSAVRWLVISDAALARAAAFSIHEGSLESSAQPLRPEGLGLVRARTEGPIAARDVGNLYLIERSPPASGSQKADGRSGEQTGGPSPHAG